MSNELRGRTRIGVAVFSAALAALWIYSGFTVATNPHAASIPNDDYRQYVAGWPSGNGVAETVAFLTSQAAKPGKPLLVAVGGFGRHGNWAIKPRLAGTPGIRFREGFVDTPNVLAELGLAARDFRVFIVEEPPVYDLPKEVLALANPAPKPVFSFERVISRLGVTDGALRVWEVSRRMRVKLPFAPGPAVPPSEPATLESVTNPNGLEGTPQRRFFWIGEGMTDVMIRSGRKGVVKLEGEFRAGPSVAGKPTRDLLIMTSGGFEEVIELGTGPATLSIPVEAGRTRIQLIGMDSKNVPAMANGDPRPLLIGVDNLKVAGFADAGVPAPKCSVAIEGDVYAAEKMATGWFRWTSKEAEVRLFTSQAGKFLLEGEYLSIVRPAKIELTLEGMPVGILNVGERQDKIQPMPPLELDLPAGNSTLRIRSGSSGVKPPGDARLLNFLVANLRAKRMDAAMACELRQ
jgi:hypothetical protein